MDGLTSRLFFQLLLYELTGDTLYREAVEGFLKWRFPGGQEPYTPCGMNYLGMWGSARSAGMLLLPNYIFYFKSLQSPSVDQKALQS